VLPPQFFPLDPPVHYEMKFCERPLNSTGKQTTYYVGRRNINKT